MDVQRLAIAVALGALTGVQLLARAVDHAVEPARKVLVHEARLQQRRERFTRSVERDIERLP